MIAGTAILGCGDSASLYGRIGGIARDEPIAVTVGVDSHIDEIGIVESWGRALERRVIESPGRRPHAPQKPCDPAPIFFEPPAAALVVEVILIPERRLLGRGRRLHGARDVLDIVGIAGDKRDDALRPERRNHASRPAAPVVTGKNRAPNSERVHQRQQIPAKRRLLA